MQRHLSDKHLSPDAVLQGVRVRAGGTCFASVLVLVFSVGTELSAEPADGLIAAEAIQAQIAGPRVAPPRFDDSDFTTPETSRYVSLNTVLFEKNRSELLPESARQLDEVANALQELVSAGTSATPSRGPVVVPRPAHRYRVIVQGHTCDLGTLHHNQALSLARAKTARDYLLEKGIAEDAIELRGWGETRPIVPNVDEPNRRLNRRVDFIVREHRSVAVGGARKLTVESEGFLDVRFEALAHSQRGARLVGDEIRTLAEDDQVRIYFRVLEGCHVYVFHRDPQGQVKWILPSVEDPHGTWRYVDQTQFLPQPKPNGEEQWYGVKGESGTEVFCVIATPQPAANVSLLVELLKRHGAAVDRSKLLPATGTDRAELHILDFTH